MRTGISLSIPSGSSQPSPAFPSAVVPGIWFDGRQAAFTDLAGTTPANVGDLLGRINEPSPLVSNWQAPTTGQRPRRDTYGAHIDYIGSPASQWLVHTSTPSFSTIDCTLAISWMARDGGAGPSEGLFRGGAFGLYAGGGTLAATHSVGSANWVPSVPTFTAAKRITFVCRYTATGLKAWVMIDGVLYTDTLVQAITGGTVSSQMIIGDQNGANSGMYGSVSQAMLIPGTVTDASAQALAQWMDSQSVPTAFPTTSRLFAVQGDSIARNIPGAPIYQAWAWLALSSLRSTYPDCELYNGAASGAGASGVINSAANYYSAARSRNVMTISVGTNDLATGTSAATTLATILAQYDAALAIGWRPAIATILDRTAGLSVSQAAFDAARATVNAGILASGRTVIDLTGIAGISANGASAGANFIGDGIHPGAGGHALMAPPAVAVMLALAA